MKYFTLVFRYNGVQFPNLKGKNLSEDVQKCLIPNCLSTTWKILRQESFVLENENENANIEFRFDSGLKVKLFIV